MTLAGAFGVVTVPGSDGGCLRALVNQRIRLLVTVADHTQGFERGNVTYCYMLEERPVPLGTRVVKRAELADALPPDTATVTADERVAAMWARFNGIRQRYEL